MLTQYANIDYLAGNIGVDPGLMTYVVGILLTFPMGLAMSFVPFGVCRYISTTLLGSCLLYFTLGDQWLHILFTSASSYAMICLLPRSVTKYVVPCFAMLYCSYSHINRQFYNIEWDFSCAQMMLTIKLYSLAWNLWDGEQIQNKKCTDWTRATTNNKRFAVCKTPSIIEYFGYCLDFSSCLIGPVYEFATYKQICDGHLITEYYRKYGKYPSRSKHILIPLGTAIFFATYHLYFISDYYIIKDGVSNAVGKSILYLIMADSVYKAKFYFAWKSMEAANNIWYAGYEGMDASGEVIGWEHTNNIDILEIETTQTTKSFSRSWNKKTSNWLNRYVHQRHKGNLILVYTISAIWHGFYPGYYITFLSAAFASICEQVGRKYGISLFVKDTIFYKLARVVMMKCVISYFLLPFILLTWDKSYETLKSQYFWCHGAFAAIYFICPLVLKKITFLDKH